MRRTIRQTPRVGMPVRVLHLGVTEHGTIESIADDGRTLVVNGERFTLRKVNARYVREGERSYGTRLAFGDGEAGPSPSS